VQFLSKHHVGFQLVKGRLDTWGGDPLATLQPALGNEFLRLPRISLILNAVITPFDDAI
jgi:hypothetical protein